MPIITPSRRVNWGDSITKDLVFLVDGSSFVGANGNLPINLAGKLTGATGRIYSRTVTEGTAPFGRGIQFPVQGSSEGYKFGAASEFYGKTYFTVMWNGVFHVNGDVGSNASLFGCGNTGVDYNWQIACDNDIGSAGTAKWYWFGKYAVNVASNKSYAYNVPTTIVGTYDGATMSLYIDGALDNTGATTGSTSTSGNIYLNNGFWDGPACIVRSAAIWDRVLTPGEIGRLANNPMRSLLAPATSLLDLRVAAAVGGGAGFKPYWARNSNVMIGVSR